MATLVLVITSLSPLQVPMVTLSNLIPNLSAHLTNPKIYQQFKSLNRSSSEFCG